MRWTDRAPTIPGAYWWRCQGMTEMVVVDYDRDEKDRARAERPRAPLYQYEPGLARASRVTQKDGEWYGPVPQPT